MIFKEIELSEALRIIGEGNPDKNLFLSPILGDRSDLQDYELYNVYAQTIKDRKWFIRIEEDNQ